MIVYASELSAVTQDIKRSEWVEGAAEKLLKEGFVFKRDECGGVTVDIDEVTQEVVQQREFESAMTALISKGNSSKIEQLYLDVAEKLLRYLADDYDIGQL
jgi:HEPN domain-containing protein